MELEEGERTSQPVAALAAKCSQPRAWVSRQSLPLKEEGQSHLQGGVGVVMDNRFSILRTPKKVKSEAGSNARHVRVGPPSIWTLSGFETFWN